MESQPFLFYSFCCSLALRFCSTTFQEQLGSTDQRSEPPKAEAKIDYFPLEVDLSLVFVVVALLQCIMVCGMQFTTVLPSVYFNVPPTTVKTQKHFKTTQGTLGLPLYSHDHFSLPSPLQTNYPFSITLILSSSKSYISLGKDDTIMANGPYDNQF